LLAGHWRSVSVVLAGPAPDGVWDLPDVRLVSATGPGVHLMIRGDLNPLLRRLATLDVRDLSITTPEIEDVFMGYYGAAGEPADEPEAVGHGDQDAPR
jgi:ABC-2 type transport system ATP-binding protein